MSERLQKLLARVGLGSRRQIEDWIRQGRITVNGVTAHLGIVVNGAEKIHINGKLASIRPFGQQRRVLAYYKPVGEMSSRHDPEGRPTIFEHLPPLHDSRWIAVGRLDLNTQGLLLLTNDGELANRLMHPSSQIEREYAVRVLGAVTPEMLKRLREGVTLEDGLAHFDEVRDVGGEGVNHWYHVILREGRTREVRRLWESQGVTVSRLTRVRYGTVTLRRGLHPGQWDELDEVQIRSLLDAVGGSPRVSAPEKLVVEKLRRPSRPSSRGARPNLSRDRERETTVEPRKSYKPWEAKPSQTRDNQQTGLPGPRPFKPAEPRLGPPRDNHPAPASRPRATVQPGSAKSSECRPASGPRRPLNPGRGKFDR